MTSKDTLSSIHRRPDGGPYFGAWSVFEIESAFQPLFRFQNGKAVIGAFEGLVRARRNGEQISPGAFFPLIPAIDRVEVETLMRGVHLMNAGAFLDPNALLFVNFDPSVLSQRFLVDRAIHDLRNALASAGIDSRRLVCEMTEQKTSSDELLFDFVSALRRGGYRIAVDDYGSDDSDMERIRRLKPDIIKFDAHWIVKLMDSNPGFALLEAMVKRFKGEGIMTVFEGIEEHWQLELAEHAGVDFVQGFVLARPTLFPFDFNGFRVSEKPPAQSAAEPVPSFVSPVAMPGPARPARAFGRRSA